MALKKFINDLRHSRSPYHIVDAASAFLGNQTGRNLIDKRYIDKINEGKISFNIRNIYKPSKGVLIAAVVESASCYQSLSKFTGLTKEEISQFDLDFVKANPSVIKYIANPSYELACAAIEADFFALRHVSEPTYEQAKLGIDQNILALKSIKHQTEEMCLYALSKDTLAMNWVDEVSPKILAYYLQHEQPHLYQSFLRDSEFSQDLIINACKINKSLDISIFKFIKMPNFNSFRKDSFALNMWVDVLSITSQSLRLDNHFSNMLSGFLEKLEFELDINKRIISAATFDKLNELVEQLDNQKIMASGLKELVIESNKALIERAFSSFEIKPPLENKPAPDKAGRQVFKELSL